MSNVFHEGAAALREKAINGLQQGDVARAELHFANLLEIVPGDVEALQFVASRHLSRGDGMRAIGMLLIAKQTAPENGNTLHQLGTAQMAVGDVRGAARNLRRAVELAPQLFMARLRLGMALEELKETHEALIAYFAAVNVAQAQGQWLSDQTTPPGLRGIVTRTIGFIDERRHQLFDQVLEPLRQLYGRGELTRVEDCLAMYLGRKELSLPDPRQKPKFLYFPGVPSQTYYGSDRFSWHAALEAAMEPVLEELRDVLATRQSLQPFLEANSSEELGGYLSASEGRDAAWDAYFFYRHGIRHDQNCARCPRTSSLLDEMPLVRIRDHAPETLFSVLRPGTHILPHRGVTNTRLVTHLPLIVPPDCALRVGGETHIWEEGRCVTFDDTFEHEAWNKSSETRVVLIADSWNPDLSEVERAAVTDLVGAIGDFNRSCE
jgi:aspartate beta-hydroxylase